MRCYVCFKALTIEEEDILTLPLMVMRRAESLILTRGGIDIVNKLRDGIDIRMAIPDLNALSRWGF